MEAGTTALLAINTRYKMLLNDQLHSFSKFIHSFFPGLKHNCGSKHKFM